MAWIVEWVGTSVARLRPGEADAREPGGRRARTPPMPRGIPTMNDNDHNNKQAH